MSKQKESSRKSSPGKKKIPALYRKLETFTLDLTKRVDCVPNKPMLSGYIKRLSNELVDCLASTRYAYTTQDYETRYEYLSEMEVHLELVRSIVNILFEYASTTNSRFMTPDQHSAYLICLDDIERQRKNWADSTFKMIGTPLSPAHVIPPDLDLRIPENSHFMPLEEDRIVTEL